MDIVVSKNNVPIRLTAERWQHITIGHPEVAPFYFEVLEAIQDPEEIYLGGTGEYLAVKIPLYDDKFLIAVYRETDETDGFVITAYISNKINQLQRKTLIWKR